MQPTRSNRIEITMYKVAKPQRGAAGATFTHGLAEKGADEYEYELGR